MARSRDEVGVLVRRSEGLPKCSATLRAARGQVLHRSRVSFALGAAQRFELRALRRRFHSEHSEECRDVWRWLVGRRLAQVAGDERRREGARPRRRRSSSGRRRGVRRAAGTCRARRRAESWPGEVPVLDGALLRLRLLRVAPASPVARSAVEFRRRRRRRLLAGSRSTRDRCRTARTPPPGDSNPPSSPSRRRRRRAPSPSPSPSPPPPLRRQAASPSPSAPFSPSASPSSSIAVAVAAAICLLRQRRRLRLRCRRRRRRALSAEPPPPPARRNSRARGELGGEGPGAADEADHRRSSHSSAPCAAASCCTRRNWRDLALEEQRLQHVDRRVAAHGAGAARRSTGASGTRRPTAPTVSAYSVVDAR